MKYAEVCLSVLFSPLLVSAPHLALPLEASAQVAVYDPANHAQNILQAVRALQELDNQVRQLAHEIDMIEKMARDLETLPVEVAHAIIRDRINRIEELIREAEGIGATTETVDREFEERFPLSYGEDPPAPDALLADARARWETSRAAHKQVIVLAAEARSGNIADAGALAQLVTESQDAAGNLQALQAANQINALSAQQLMQLEALLGASIRAEALETSRALAEAERGRARLSAFLGH